VSDVPLKVLGISDPAFWAAEDWANDAIPHLFYGAVTLFGAALGRRHGRACAGLCSASAWLVSDSRQSLANLDPFAY
jgi:hypothetical protein